MFDFVRLSGIFVATAGICVSAAADPVGNPAEGHRLALKICAACHVVAADQEEAPLLRNPAPSFQAIANRPGTTAASVQHFVQTIHRTFANGTDMPNPELTEDQAADIASYVVSLQPAKPSAKP